ncbi:MAG TPA: GAF domain-containing protein, partial [Vicinamibacterales bacterium]|nr:GAF domain-containing protein [Vicinamibacterales bacterium]
EVLVVERDALRAEAEAFRRLAERTEAEVELLRRQAAGRAGDGAGGARLLQEAVRALDALSEATSVEALFETLARQVGTHVSRVAVFRVRGHHLEGEYGVGFESAGEIAKLMIPFGVDSLLARAATSGTLVRAAAEQLGETPPPVGGTAAAALAVPLMLHGQALAVLYADSPEAVTDAQAAIALLLARQAATVLSRLARELKTVEELREYAALLVDEAQHIFHADLESGCSEPERLRRLRDSIDCARQLFAQRAALESPSVAALFEKHLASIADAGSPFGRALLDLVERPESQRTAAS